MKPMLASPGPLPAQASGAWAYEIKWDGMRVLAHRRSHELRLTTRTGADATERFPEISSSIPDGLPEGSVLDGEVVVLDEAGRSSFSMLAPRIQSRGGLRRDAPKAVFILFDVLRLGSGSVLDQPYTERRRLLVEQVGSTGSLVVSDSFDDGDALMLSTAELGLEGVVAKRRHSAYQPGVRSRDWIKVPHRTSHSYVIGGWKSRVDAPARMASLLVGTPVGRGMLAFDGAVGSGLRDEEAGILVEILSEIESTPRHHFEGPVPVSAASDVLRWVEPLLVVDVAHLGRSGRGLLRQPSVVRLRPDLSYDDVATERVT